jgi:hypothetical protein
MKLNSLLSIFIVASCSIFDCLAQEAIVPPSNRSTAGLEKNQLFYATNRFIVSQQGPVSLPLDHLFDGNYHPNYSGPGISDAAPYVVTIENLPDVHIQAGGWVGWTTRYWNPVKFKIEVYNSYDYGSPGYPAPNSWITVAEVDHYTGGSYMAPVYSVSPRKIRYTFYQASGPGSQLGISELFFIHPEATTAYDGMMVKYDMAGNVGLGVTSDPAYKLSVNGKIRAKEIKVESGWADFVFKPGYQLPPLEQVEQFIKSNQHLPDIPSEEIIRKEGVSLGEINTKLLQKIEELTLYLIENSKQIRTLQSDMKILKTENFDLKGLLLLKSELSK